MASFAKLDNLTNPRVVHALTNPTNSRAVGRKLEAQCRSIFQGTPRFEFRMCAPTRLCIVFDGGLCRIGIDDSRFYLFQKFCDANSNELARIQHLEFTTTMLDVFCERGSHDVYLFYIADFLHALFSTGMLLKTFKIQMDGYVRIRASDMDCCSFSSAFTAQSDLESFQFYGTMKPSMRRNNLYSSGFDGLLTNIVKCWSKSDPTRERKFIIVSTNFFHFTSDTAIKMLCSGDWTGSISVNFGRTGRTGFKSLRRFSRGVAISNNNSSKNLSLTYVNHKTKPWERILSVASPFRRVDIHRLDSERVPVSKMVKLWKAIIDGPCTAVSLTLLIAPMNLNRQQVSYVLSLLSRLRDTNFHLVDFYPGFAPNFLDSIRNDFLNQFSFYANLNKAKRTELIPRNDVPLQESHFLNVIMNLAEMREIPYCHDHSCLTTADVNCVPTFYNIPSVPETYHVIQQNPQLLLNSVTMDTNRKRKRMPES